MIKLARADLLCLLLRLKFRYIPCVCGVVYPSTHVFLQMDPIVAALEMYDSVIGGISPLVDDEPSEIYRHIAGMNENSG